MTNMNSDRSIASSHPPTPNRDIVVIGTSAGGVEALKELVSGLPADFPAAILVVIHFPTNATSILPWILTRAGGLPATHAIDGELVKPGHIYVAPPNFHLLLVNHRIQLQFGPRVNGVRPAIDLLFQSAANTCNQRVIGVILTGTLDDGVSGLANIQAQNGITIVQDPQTALFKDLPSNAIHNAKPDYVLPLDQIGRVLAELVTETQSEEDLDPESDPSDIEAKKVETDILTYEQGETGPTARSMLTCPDCGGILWEYQEGKILQFRCHVGHVFSEEAILAEQDGALESALWTAVRVLRERAILAKRMATHARENGRHRSEALFFEQSRRSEESARLIRNMLVAPPTGNPDIGAD